MAGGAFRCPSRLIFVSLSYRLLFLDRERFKAAAYHAFDCGLCVLLGFETVPAKDSVRVHDVVCPGGAFLVDVGGTVDQVVVVGVLIQLAHFEVLLLVFCFPSC